MRLIPVALHNDEKISMQNSRFTLSVSVCVCVLMHILFSGVQTLKELCKEGDSHPSSLGLKARRILDNYLTTED